MKITDSSPIRPGSVNKKKGASSSSETDSNFFSILSSADSPTPVASQQQAAADIPPVNTMGALLSLQEMPEDEVRNRKALMQSKATLETLEQLRHALLLGNVPQHLLKNLHRMVHDQKQKVTDPRLAEVMDDIELRAAVELAKLETATQQ